MPDLGATCYLPENTQGVNLSEQADREFTSSWGRGIVIEPLEGFALTPEELSIYA